MAMRVKELKGGLADSGRVVPFAEYSGVNWR